MRKWFLLIALAAFWVSVRVPFEKTDVAKLVPVSTLVFESKEGKIHVTSDQGDAGVGNTLEEALEDLELTCTGKIFLDTVEYLLIAPGAVEYEELSEYFRPGTLIVGCNPDTDPAKAEEYLRSREGGVTLRDMEMDDKEMPLLYEIDGRYYLNGETREFVSAMGVDDCCNTGAAGNCSAEKRVADESYDWNSFGSGTSGPQ